MRSQRFAIGMLNVVWLGDLVKVLWWSGDGMCLLMKRLERGRFVWPRADGGVVCLSQAQLSMLLARRHRLAPADTNDGADIGVVNVLAAA